ncbi:MAG: pyridoxal-dependent decarboxylase [Vicinamibacterales bacterium]
MTTPSPGPRVTPPDASEIGPALDRAAHHAARFLESLASRPVGARASVADLRAALGGPLNEEPVSAPDTIDALSRGVDAGLVASAGPRYFGFVTGGSLPAALAADWLVSAWDQNAAMFVGSPAAAVLEEVAAAWVLAVTGLPAHASVGFVTGAQMANFTALAAARHAVLAREGWSVEDRGLSGAPPLRIFAGAEAHVTIGSALAMLGLGRATLTPIGADDEGRLRADVLARELRRGTGPAIVCAQAGNVNTGAFDPFDAIADVTTAHEAWLHVDGAFGLWAAASPHSRHLTAGMARADSWATDAHKWLNVPYDSGLAIVADPDAHRGAMGMSASYLVGQPDARDGFLWTPEASRRARGVAVYAALRSLGTSGLARLVERGCAHARRFANRLRASGHFDVLNDVVLNQVLVRPTGRPGDDDAATDARVARILADVQREGTCWLGGSRWHGRAVIRVSLSSWMTTDDDVDRSAAALVAAATRHAEPM